MERAVFLNLNYWTTIGQETKINHHAWPKNFSDYSLKYSCFCSNSIQYTGIKSSILIDLDAV